MQKKIIALAIAAAFSAPAFADVQVYGLVDAAVAHVSGDGQQSDTQLISGGLSTSRVGLKTAEDIGNGMKVIANLEYKIDISTASGTALATNARQQMLALAGDFGTVAAGYLQTTAYDFQNSYDPTSGSTISPLANIHKGGGFYVSSLTGAYRAQHALAYISPSFSGVTFAVNYSTAFGSDVATGAQLGLANTATTGLDTKAMLASVNYAGTSLPLAVGAVYVKTSTNNAIDTHATEYALGGSYDFGVAKIFATYQSHTPTTAGVGGSANKAESVGATVPAGPGTVVVSYAKAKMATGTPGASGETVGYLYNLSKDDTVYAAYSKMSNDAGGTAFSVDNSAIAGATMTPGGGSSMIAVGLRKKF